MPITRPHQIQPINISNEYPQNLIPRTVMNLMTETVNKRLSATALFTENIDGSWKSLSWIDYYNSVMKVAKSLVSYGIDRFAGVAIHGFNSNEWFISHLASIFSGAISTGIYPTNTSETCGYILNQANVQIVFVDTLDQLKKYTSIKDNIPTVKCFIVWEEHTLKHMSLPFTVPVFGWNDFIEFECKYKDNSINILNDRIKIQEPNNVCCYIFTSGTTGNPKGVMLSHDNLTWTAKSVSDLVEINNNDRIVSFLPLSHIAACMIDIYASLYSGCSVYFAKPDTLKGSLIDTLKKARPTMFLGVPRVWEKIEEKMRKISKNSSYSKKLVSNAARYIGLKAGLALQDGLYNPWGYTIMNKIVFDKVKYSLGLDKCRYMFTGAAPISKNTLNYFLSFGIPICELYGMSECSGPQTISLPIFNNFKIGSCGKAIPGTIIKLTDDGEIIFRGRNLFQGYLNNSDSNIDSDGFLHSGDIGELKDDFLYIVGRIKEIQITSAGENIATPLIENSIKNNSDIISNVFLIADKRNYLTVLVTLVPGLIENTTNINLVKNAIDKYNSKAISNAQKVQKFKILPNDFSVDTGELTPTLKVRRSFILNKYNTVIEEMYK